VCDVPVGNNAAAAATDATIDAALAEGLKLNTTLQKLDLRLEMQIATQCRCIHGCSCCCCCCIVAQLQHDTAEAGPQMRADCTYWRVLVEVGHQASSSSSSSSAMFRVQKLDLKCVLGVVE
jgi:hypothetical protein